MENSNVDVIVMPNETYGVVYDNTYRSGYVDGSLKGFNEGKWFGFKWGIVEGICISATAIAAKPLVEELCYKVKRWWKTRKKDEEA